MNKNRSIFIIFTIAAVIFAGYSHVFAAAPTRTWVSSTGSDSNPCSQAAPCLTFAGAFSKTAAGGEIDVLNSGSYGTLTINKAITIDGSSVLASVTVPANVGITVTAGVKDQVVIRGIEFQGNGLGLSAIKFNSAGSLYVENCKISGFTGDGIQFAPNGSTIPYLFVSGTTIEAVKNTVRGEVAGISMTATGTGTPVAVIDRCRIEEYEDGLYFSGNLAVTVSKSVISGNSGSAINSTANGTVSVIDSVLSHNSGSGVLVNSSVATVTISRNTIDTNTVAGLLAESGGTIISYGDNVVENNGTDGFPSRTNNFK